MDGLELVERIKNSSVMLICLLLFARCLEIMTALNGLATLGRKHYLLKPYQINDLRIKVAECLRQDKIFMKCKAEVMAQYRLDEDSYIEIKEAFLKVLQEYLTFLNKKQQSDNEKHVTHENILECTALFGTEQLRLLMEKSEMQKNAGREKPIILSSINQYAKK